MSTATSIIQDGMNMASFTVNAYLADLKDEELLLRPTPGSNHIAWQLGHLIASEHKLVEAVCPGTMPPLPEGYPEKYTNDTAQSDNPADFDSKDEYVRLMNEQRAGTLAALETLSDEQLAEPGPEFLRDYCPTVGSVFGMQGSHWMMHSGQWVIVRRMLGKPALF